MSPTLAAVKEAPQTPPRKFLYSVRQACEALGVGKTTLYDLMNNHGLAYVRVGDRRMLRAEDLEAFVRELSAE